MSAALAVAASVTDPSTGSGTAGAGDPGGSLARSVAAEVTDPSTGSGTAGAGDPGGSLARSVAAEVTDPEMPMLTLEDLGVLRDVEESDGRVTVTITPTYSGCPAMATMRDDLVHRLTDAGYDDVEVRVSLTPAWSSDWITERGRRALAAHHVSPPGAAPRHDGPVALSLLPTRRAVRCPRCEADDVRLVSEFGATACKAVYSCGACLETFDHVKEI